MSKLNKIGLMLFIYTTVAYWHYVNDIDWAGRLALIIMLAIWANMILHEREEK